MAAFLNNVTAPSASASLIPQSSFADSGGRQPTAIPLTSLQAALTPHLLSPPAPQIPSGSSSINTVLPHITSANLQPLRKSPPPPLETQPKPKTLSKLPPLPKNQPLKFPVCLTQKIPTLANHSSQSPTDHRQFILDDPPITHHSPRNIHRTTQPNFTSSFTTTPQQSGLRHPKSPRNHHRQYPLNHVYSLSPSQNYRQSRRLNKRHGMR